MTFGVDRDAMVTAISVRETASPEGATSLVSIVTPMGKAQYRLNMTGKHHVRNSLAALSAALLSGATLDEATRGIEQFSAAYGRSELKWHNGTAYLCDYYNANPTSVEAAIASLESLEKQTGAKTVVLVLADMLELGTMEEKWHRDLAPAIQTLAKSQVTPVHTLLTGPKMKWLQSELEKDSAKHKLKTTHFDTKQELAVALKEMVNPGTLVLIKGSRGMKMEEVYQWITTQA